MKAFALIVFTIIENELIAFLQKRGEWNFVKMKPETHPGYLQATAHGKLRKKEEHWNALFRETEEELGQEFKN